MGNLNTAVARMRYWCSEANLGYDQSQRWNIVPGGEADCSSLVIHVLREAGFDTGGATYTGNMRANLTARGWMVVATYPQSAAGLQAGDVLLNDANHVAMYLGGGYLGQASIDERGWASGGQSGDQTDHETNVSPFYVYAHGGWPHVLRYTGGQTAVVTASLSADPYNPNGYDVAYVKDVQSRLESLGYSVGASGVDGILGADTFNAVKAYQAAVGLTTDGIPGPDTLGALKAGKGREAVANALSDGVWGPVTTGALQRILGTPQDGVISSQDQGRRVNVPAAGDGWEWVSNPQGSQVIQAYQSRLGVDADGIIGPGTIRRLQDHLGVTVDGYAGRETVKALQAQLGQGRI